MIEPQEVENIAIGDGETELWIVFVCGHAWFKLQPKWSAKRQIYLSIGQLILLGK